MRLRTLFVVLFVVASFLSASGCALFEEEKDLPHGRRVRVVFFPVRSLEFQEARSRQELENLTLSGSLKNVSSMALSNIRLRGIIHYAREKPSDKNEVRQVLSTDVFVLFLNPSLLQPAESGDFSLAMKVEHTVSHIELHVMYEPFVPSEF